MKAFMRVLCNATWLLSAIGASSIGLAEMFNFDLFTLQGIANIAQPLKWIIGISGIISLVFYVMHSLGMDAEWK